MIMQRNALHLKDIGLNVGKKDLKIKNGLIKTVKLPRNRSRQLQNPSRDIPKILLCEGSTIGSRGTISV